MRPSHLLKAAALTALSLAAAPADKPADQKPSAFATIRALTGTWVSDKPMKEGAPPLKVVFKPTSGGTAITETMCPDTPAEMINVYTLDGDGATLTHYCHMGNQPHMRAPAPPPANAATDAPQTLHFAFVDGGNLKSRDDAHMDSLDLTLTGDHLTELWSFYKEGKVTGKVTFDLKRQK